MKRFILMLTVFFTIFVLSGCISIPIGDGDSLKLSKDGMTIKSKDGEETSFSADEQDGSFSVQGTDADGKETDIQIETSGEIPEDFPTDIPIPKEAEITTTNDSTIDGSRMMHVSYVVESGEADVTKYGDLYRDYIEKMDYEKQVDSDYNGESIQLGAMIDDRTSLQVMVNKDDTDVIVILSYTILAEEEA